jgi:hypothetical protein
MQCRKFHLVARRELQTIHNHGSIVACPIGDKSFMFCRIDRVMNLLSSPASEGSLQYKAFVCIAIVLPLKHPQLLPTLLLFSRLPAVLSSE